MTSDRLPVLTGGCQCGAVRYAFYAEPAAADICHCRMCQKAMGNLFMAYASVPRKEFGGPRARPPPGKVPKSPSAGSANNAGRRCRFAT